LTPAFAGPEGEDPRASATREDLFRLLDELGIPHRTVQYRPVHTVDEARAHRGELPGGHCKNLFLKDRKGRLFLVVMLEDRPIDIQKLARHLGVARLSFGNPDLLREALGVEPGSVTPFALMNDRRARVEAVLDRDMLEHDPLHYHPLENDATTAIAAEDLLRFIAACGHRPRIVDFEDLTPSG